METLSVWFITGKLPPLFSGAGRNDSILAPRCSKNGIKVTLVTPRTNGAKRRDTYNGLPLIRIGCENKKLNKIKNILDILWALLTSHKPDMIRFRGFSFSSAVSIFLIKLLFPSIKIVIQPALFGADDLDTVQSKPTGHFEIKQMLRADAIFAMNPKIKESFIKHKYKEDHIFPVFNSVDVETFNPIDLEERNMLRSKLGIPLDAFVVTTMGMLCERKKQYFITKAFLCFSLKVDNTNMYLLHVGPNPADIPATESAKLKSAQAEELKINQILSEDQLSENVQLCGKQDKPALFMKISNIFVHASIEEGEANVVNEALACGLPTLIPEHEIFKEQVPPECALRFVPDNTDSLANQLFSIYKNQHQQSKISNLAREHIMTTRTPSIVAPYYANLLRKANS